MMKYSKKFYWCSLFETDNALYNVKLWLGSHARRFVGRTNLHDIELGHEMNMRFQGDITINHYLEGQNHVLDVSIEITREE